MIERFIYVFRSKCIKPFSQICAQIMIKVRIHSIHRIEVSKQLMPSVTENFKNCVSLQYNLDIIYNVKHVRKAHIEIINNSF